MTYPNVPRYELTEAAQETARNLVEDWGRQALDQTFYLVDVTAGSDNQTQLIQGRGFLEDNARIPSLNSLKELEDCDLISLQPVISGKSKQYEITLRQSLINAVNSGFLKPGDLGLSGATVGTYVVGNLNNYGQYQSSASSHIEIQNITFPEFIIEIQKILGNDLLDKEPNVKRAVSDLNETVPTNRIQKLGNLLSMLANIKTIGEVVPQIVSVVDLIGKVMQSKGIL